MKRYSFLDIDVRENIARDDDESLIEKMLRILHAASCAEVGLGKHIPHRDAVLRPIGEVLCNVLGLEVEQRYYIAYAALFQQLYDMLHHWPVGNGNHGLRTRHR